MTMIAS